MSMPLSPYYHPDANQSMVEGMMHREAVGGLWDELGALRPEPQVIYNPERGNRSLNLRYLDTTQDKLSLITI